MKLIPILLTAFSVTAQQIDTGNFAAWRRQAALADRADSNAERRDFLQLQKTVDPGTRRALADSFVARYPQSWLLASVYQISAAASLEMKDYTRTLVDGRAALRLLPENAPLLLALAQIEAATGRMQDAGRDASDVLLWLSVFAPPADTKPSAWKSTRESLEGRARSLIEQAGGRIPRTEVAERERDNGRREKFAGSEACSTCHAKVYESWRATGMAAMLRQVADAAVLADFSRVHEFRGADGLVKVRTGGGSRPYMEFARADGGWTRFRIDYTIGSKWQQAYATRLADERIFVFPIQFSGIEKRWLNYWSTIDPPASERAAIDQFPRLSSATNYQRNCAVCHTSQLGLMRLDDETLERAAFREPGVNCEMCHGPAARHVAAMRTGNLKLVDSADPPFRFSRLDHVEATLICGQCHRQSGMRNLGSNGEMNYTTEKPYFSRLLSQPYVEFGTRAFFKDGRFRETTFIGEAFMRSACFRRGTAQCASCHNPHPPDAIENRTSLKFALQPDQMCLQCHPATSASASGHTRHAPDSPGSRCVACHMPPIMNSLLFRARSHQIDDIPRADTTMRFGQKESPNACLVCHSEKDTAWLARQLEDWHKRPTSQ